VGVGIIGSNPVAPLTTSKYYCNFHSFTMHRDVITSVVYPTECTTSVALRWINKIRDNFTVFFMTVLNF
jgi:hypothetical protein